MAACSLSASDRTTYLWCHRAWGQDFAGLQPQNMISPGAAGWYTQVGGGGALFTVMGAYLIWVCTICRAIDKMSQPRHIEYIQSLLELQQLPVG